MKNEETLKARMDRRLSFLDGLPSCRSAVMQRIAQEEAPVMKKKISLGLVLALILVSLSVAGLAAAALLFSPKADAARVADRALEERYGVTPEMQTFFVRSEEELPGGAVRVTYAGRDQLLEALGTYTARVKDGKAEISWSYDGKDTSGLYGADAWGAEQLKQMLADNQETGDMGLFLPRALEIAQANGNPWQDAVSTEEEAIAYFERLEAEKTAALAARKLPEDEMAELARQAVIEAYSLTAEQAAALEKYVQPLADEENAWYWMEDGKPCFEVQYFLSQGPDGAFVEKDGAYGVLVNVETGVIERIVYESGLGGEG